MSGLPPQAGCLAELGEDSDRADAGDLLMVLRAARVQLSKGRSGASKVVREALWWMWEQPRLPRPLIRLKYPAAYPWSPGARAALAGLRDAGRPDGALRGVVIEHLIPAAIMVREALEDCLELDVDGLVLLLRRHGAATVVTVAEDKLLSAAGLASSMPADWDKIDLWARPRAVGLDPAAFSPIQARPGPTSAVRRLR